MKKLIMICFAIPVIAFSGEYGNCCNTINQTTINQAVTNEIDRQTDATLGIANNHAFNLASKDMQWSVGVANYENSTATSFAIGQRLEHIFLHGSVTVDDETSKTAYFVGASGKF